MFDRIVGLPLLLFGTDLLVLGQPLRGELAVADLAPFSGALARRGGLENIT